MPPRISINSRRRRLLLKSVRKFSVSGNDLDELLTMTSACAPMPRNRIHRYSMPNIASMPKDDISCSLRSTLQLMSAPHAKHIRPGAISPGLAFCAYTITLQHIIATADIKVFIVFMCVKNVCARLGQSICYGCAWLRSQDPMDVPPLQSLIHHLHRSRLESLLLHSVDEMNRFRYLGV